MKRLLGLLLLLAALCTDASLADANKKTGAEASAITGSDTAKAVAAAKALATSKARSANDTLLDALATGLHPEVATAALDALAQRRVAVAYDTVSFYLDHRNPKVRAAAVTAVAATGHERANKHVLAALRDGNSRVRAAAAGLVAERKIKGGVEPLLALLTKGDEAAAPALAQMADPDLARVVGELIGKAPDALVARVLGNILLRADFKPEEARVQVVRALGKVPGNDALEHLTSYVGSIPENPPRQSRREAEAIIEQRLGGE